MFGLSRQEKIKKKLQKEGVRTTGTIVSIGRDPNILLAKALFGVQDDGKQVVTVRYKTQAGTEEQMLLRVMHPERYQLHAEMEIRYILFEGRYIAVPEQLEP